MEPDNCECGFSLTPERSYVFWHQSGGSLFLLWYVCVCVWVGARSCFANGKPATIESKHFLSFCIFFSLGMPCWDTQHRPRRRTRAQSHMWGRRAAAAEARRRVSLWTGCALRWGETPHVTVLSFCFHSFLELVVYFSLPCLPHKSLLKLVDAVLMPLKERDHIILINNYREFFWSVTTDAWYLNFTWTCTTFTHTDFFNIIPVTVAYCNDEPQL